MTAKNKPKLGPLTVWIVGHPQNPLIHGETTTSNCLAVFYKKKDADKFKRAHEGTFYKVMKATITRDNYEGDLEMLRRDLLAARQERDSARKQLDEKEHEIMAMEKWNAQCDEKTRHADAFKEGEIKSLEQQLRQAREDLASCEVARQYAVDKITALERAHPENPKLTPRAHAAISLAHKEAVNGGQTYVGTEHILLGLLRQGEGIAKRHFIASGMTYEKAEYAMRVGRVS